MTGGAGADQADGEWNRNAEPPTSPRNQCGERLTLKTPTRPYHCADWRCGFHDHASFNLILSKQLIQQLAIAVSTERLM